MLGGLANYNDDKGNWVDHVRMIAQPLGQKWS